MRSRSFVAAALPLLVSLLAAPAMAQLEHQLAGLTRSTSALRFQGANCSPVNAGCTTNLPATSEPWSGGTGYDATSGAFWVSNGALLARVSARGCQVQCGPYLPPVLGNATVTGIEVLELGNELLLIDSRGVLNTLSLNGSCQSPQLTSTCGTGLARQGSQVTSGLAADEARDLVFVSYTDFSTGGNEIAIIHKPTSCMPFIRTPLPNCGLAGFGACRGLAIDSCRRTLYATDGLRLLRARYTFDPSTMSVLWGPVSCCPLLTTNLDPYVGLALRPNPGRPVGQPCNNGSCLPCPMRHQLLTGPVLGNSNLLFALDDAQDNSWTWLGLGFGHCRPIGPTIAPLCGPILLGGFSAATPPLVAGPFPVNGAGPCNGSTTVVVDFPYDPAFCNTDWSSQFISLCFQNPTAPYGTAISNCLSWTVITP